MMNLLDFLQSNGLELLPIFDGMIHRFEGQSKKSKSGWYVGHQNGADQFLIIGDWSTGDVQKWSSKKSNLKSEDFIEKMNRATIEANNMRAEMHAIASDKCRELFSKPGISIGLESFEYAKRKGITSLHGTSIYEDKFGVFLAIPLIDNSDKIWTMQKIYSDGSKIFYPGGKKSGNYFLIHGSIDVVYLCEGFATGCSIHEATGATVAVAFDAGNLLAVGQNIKARFASSKIICCADNDQFSKENIGVKKANDLRTATGIQFIIPEFNDGLKDQRPTDFNDLHLLSGLDSVKKMLIVDSIENVSSLETPEFYEYKKFFESLFPNTRKCILSGAITSKKDGSERPVSVENLKQIIRGYATMRGLNKSKADDFFEVWLYLIKPELLLTIPEYDNIDYINEVLRFVSVENIKHEYFVEIFKEWCGKIFSRLNDSNVQNKMMILGGKQGIGKDTFIKSMFGSLGQYITDYGINEKDADNFETMIRHLLINISEFDRTSKLHVSQLKNIITASNATYRAAYGKTSKTVDLHASFISSVNVEDIFRDETGNRRFIYFKISALDWNYPKHLSMNILSQAMFLSSINYKASDKATKAMDLIIESMTPESWESYAASIWESRIAELERFMQKSEFSYAEINSIIREISLSLGVSIRMIQGFIKRNYQKRNCATRTYIKKPAELLSNNATLC